MDNGFYDNGLYGEPLHPKDERLFRVALDYGRVQAEVNALMGENRELRERLGESELQVKRAQAEADRERGWKDRLQETYDKLNKYALKQEKVVEKLKKEKNNG